MPVTRTWSIATLTLTTSSPFPSVHFWQDLIFSALLLSLVRSTQGQIPSIQTFTRSSSSSAFVLSASVQITVDTAFQDYGSPSLLSYARTFQSDLVDVSGLSGLPDVAVGSLPTSSDPPSIFLTLGGSNHTLFNGQQTGEGYDFEITSGSYVIKGAEAIGAWWGTRTLLQQVVLSLANGGGTSMSIQAGSGSDTPGWEVRGFMLDAGRHWFQPAFLTDLCIYASFFKLQTMHIHASDNLWNPDFLDGPDWRSLYSGFRFTPFPDSPIAGLVPIRNESWSKDEFTAIQSTCTAHGVTLIPEIDTPGHSLVITKWKPELMVAGSPDHLNLTYPDTIPTIKAIWDEVLPWFTSSEVSIGADEYDPALADDYISFVNEMASYISAQSGKSIRVWGTNEPSNTSSISTDVTIQHWDFPGDSIPVQLMQKGYRVINSEQQFLYLDGKTSDDGQFPVELSASKLWRGAPGGRGWAPNIFSASDPTNNTSIDNPLLRGSIMALWNDWGNNATTPLEIYYQLAKSLAMFSEKVWAGSEARDTALTQDEFESMYPSLNAAAPGQNLNRAVKVSNNVVFRYDGTVSFPIITSYDSVGPPYTLKFTVKPSYPTETSVSLYDGSYVMIPYPDDGGGVLFAGRDSKLHVKDLTFEDPSTRVLYPLGYTLPSDSDTTVEIHATREYTYALINGSPEKHWWTTNLDIWGEYMKQANMSFAAPSNFIGTEEFAGDLKDVSLTLG